MRVASILTASLALCACLPSAFDRAEQRYRERRAANAATEDSRSDVDPRAGSDAAGAGASGSGTDRSRSGAAGAAAAAAGSEATPSAPPDAGHETSAPEPAPDAAPPPDDSAPPLPDAGATPPDAGSAEPAPADAASSCGDTTTDPEHCGSCDSSCAASAALVSCVESSCQRACMSAYADCNVDLGFGSEGNGCETSVTDDVDNCGGCSVRCNRSAGSVPECEASSCGSYRATASDSSPATDVIHGSVDGGRAYSQLCGRDEVLVGIDSPVTGPNLYGLAVLCAPLQLGGVPSNLDVGQGPAVAAPLIGNLVDPPASVTRFQCPAGSVVISVEGGTRYFGENDTLYGIKALALTCARLGVDGERNIQFSPAGLLEAGSATGSVEEFRDGCPEGHAVVGFSGRVGALLDGLQTHCARLEISREESGSMAPAE